MDVPILSIAIDEGKALKWLKIAADEGDAFAHSMLAIAYSRGDFGVVPDEEIALFHGNAASELGDLELDELRRELENFDGD